MPLPHPAGATARVSAAQQASVVQQAGATPRVGAVDGLRGLALLLVVAFHLFGQGRVSGGVDVFLALSGYFATGTLLRRAEGGTLRLAAHYARTLARLLPAALVVLAAVTVALLALAPRLRWSAGLREVGASATFWENWELVHSALAYGAAGPDASPLQHFWSLSVQGQFFAVWPLVVLGLVAVARRRALAGRGPLTPRRLVSVVTAAATAASFAHALWLVHADQQVAYFSTFTRFWEVGVGALLALLLPHAGRAASRAAASRAAASRAVAGTAAPAGRARSRLVRSWLVRSWLARGRLGWAGLALVVGSGFVVDGADVFPGAWALVPVGGAALVLIATVPGPTAGAHPTGPPSHGVERLLDSAPLRLGARVSYALYLWHWPVLVFWLLTTGAHRANPLTAAGVLVISATLAWLTTRYVAEPLLAHVSARLAARPPASAVVPHGPAASADRAGHANPASPADRAGSPHQPGPADLVGDVTARAAGTPSGRRTLAVLAGAAVLMLGGAQAAATAHDLTVRHSVDGLLALSPDHPGAAALAPGSPDPGPRRDLDAVPFRPATWVAYDDHPDRPDCAQGGDRSELLECTIVAQDDPAAVVYLAGASHEQQYEEAFAALARAHGWELREMLKHGCRLATPGGGESAAGTESTGEGSTGLESEGASEGPESAGPVSPSCAAWNEQALAALVAARPDAVVVIGSRTYEDGSPEQVLPGQVGAWRALDDAGIRVVTVRDNPRFEWFVPECVDAAGFPEACGRPRTEQLAAVSPVPTAPGVPAAAVHLDLTDSICGPEVCAAVVGNVLVYRDDDHLTNTYVRTLTPVLGRQLRAGAPWLFADGPVAEGPGEDGPSAGPG
ncbi:acyltransferase family protein [Promicromonospora sp. NPDC059942]|uniref:acyltransferase family protein n=1 Tax=Promicromonospora sp. NPDC059942 TaxID=3347009 RepID=UPI0036602DC6